MRIYVTRAPTVPLTSYDTKRSSHLNAELVEKSQLDTNLVFECNRLHPKSTCVSKFIERCVRIFFSRILRNFQFESK